MAKIENVREVIENGYPMLLADINGQPARMDVFYKRRWLDEYDAVFLGHEWEGRTQVDVPANPDDGQGPIVLDGFMADKDLATLYRDWLIRIGGR
jgi:hypothetical protein